ncbi:MAG: hypothetical protein NXI21_13715 [Alphaproteobacteria bacterium]|nr:hypothetical protein [Alphaproteobacteria bacterium]
MTSRRAAVAVIALLALSACGEEDADQNAATGAAADGAEAALNCRRDLPPPPLSADDEADLALSIDSFSHAVVDDRNRYPHVRRFAETAGVPITIYRGKVCVDEGQECVDACVTYRIEGGTTLVQADHHVATRRDADRITLRYWARDDGGNFHELSATIVTDGPTARLAE